LFLYKSGYTCDISFPIQNAFTELLKLLRPMFDSNGLILSAAVSAGVDTIDRSYDVPALGK
jgi:hypothetical protein